MAKYVTIMDIARVLGISKSTVSRALSGDTGNVKAETLQKILATAEQMGYHRNELAVHLRQQSTHNIGIIIPEIVTTFYMIFINEAQAILRRQGYKVMIAISNENPEQERENILMMEQLRVDGILMSACDKERNVDLYNKVIERGIPIVFLTEPWRGSGLPKCAWTIISWRFSWLRLCCARVTSTSSIFPVRLISATVMNG